MSSHINKSILALGVISYFLAGGAQAANDYRCTIEKRITASAEPPSIQKAQEMAHIGKQFTVERETGIMAGALFNAFNNDPEIVDDGATGNSFKVVTTIKQEEEHVYGSNIYALIINEHEKLAQKPFVFMENDVVYLGNCEHVKLSR